MGQVDVEGCLLLHKPDEQSTFPQSHIKMERENQLPNWFSKLLGQVNTYIHIHCASNNE